MEIQYKLRGWEQQDVKDLMKYANNPEIARFMTNRFPHPYTQKHAEDFIAFASGHNPLRLFAIEIAGEAVGGVGIHPQEDVHCKNAELGYWIGAPFQGKGIITHVIQDRIVYAFEHFDINRIFGLVYGNNPASLRVLQKCGFKEEARFYQTIYKNGEFLDAIILAIRRPD